MLKKHSGENRRCGVQSSVPAEALANEKSNAVFQMENGIVVSSDHWYVARLAACF